MLEGRSAGQGKPQQLVNLDYYSRFITVDQQSASQGTSRNCEPIVQGQTRQDIKC